MFQLGRQGVLLSFPYGSHSDDTLDFWQVWVWASRRRNPTWLQVILNTASASFLLAAGTKSISLD